MSELVFPTRSIRRNWIYDEDRHDTIDLRTITVRCNPNHESEFRRGYRSGYIDALNQLASLHFVHDWPRVYNAFLEHWRSTLAEWASDRDTEFRLAPKPKELFCVYCGKPAEHMDHVMPKSRGGSDDPSNLVPACSSCNWSKGAKTLEEWRG